MAGTGTTKFELFYKELSQERRVAVFENPDDTMSGGHDACLEALSDPEPSVGQHLPPAGQTLLGYVFYHTQDLEGVLAGRPLHLAHATLEEGAPPEAAGQAACECLRSAGLQCEWDGSVDHRIKVAIPAEELRHFKRVQRSTGVW